MIVPSRLPEAGSNMYSERHRPFLMFILGYGRLLVEALENGLPEVIWAVLVRDDDYGNFRVVFYRVNSVGRICKMLFDICGEALKCRLSKAVVSVLAF